MSLMSTLIKNSNPTTFKKGEDLHKKGMYSASNIIYIDEDENRLKYYASYEGSVDTYRQSLILNNDDVEDLNCTCPAFYQFGGYCKHCIALGFTILNKKTKDEKVDNEFNKLLENDDNYIMASIIPYIKRSGGIYTLELKIDLGKEYVIRSIKEFLEAIKYEYTIQFGKTTYTANIEYFDECSKALINLLMDQHFAHKEINLSDTLFDKIFDIYRGKVINLHMNNKRRILLENEDYDLIVNVEGDKLKIDKGYYVSGFINNYVLINNSLFRIKKIERSVKKLYNILFRNYELSIKGYEKEFVKKFYKKMDNVIVPENFNDIYKEDEISIDTYLDYDGSIRLNYSVYVNGVIDNDYNDIDNEKYSSYLRYIKGLKFYNNEINDIFEIVEFINTDISKFREYGILYVTERLNSLSVERPSRMNISVRYNLDLLELDVENDDLTNEEISKILSAYKKKKKYIRLKGNIIDVSSFTDLDIINELNIDTKNILGTHIVEGYNVFKLSKYLNKDSHEIINKFSNLSKLSYEINSKLNNVLREYQMIGFNWLSLISECRFGGILADDMGLGKTLQIISLLESDKSNKSSLIVCPTSLIYNWANEVLKWGFDNVFVINGLAPDRLEVINNLKDNYIYVTSYDSLRRDIDFYKYEFRYIIADEAQFIKNNKALKTKAIKKLKSDVRYALTGTPVENRLSDLWSIFDFILPNYLGDYNTFREKYEIPVSQNDKEALNVLVKKITPFVLRRCKKDVLKELPPRIEEIIYVNMADDQRKLYDSYFLDAKRRIDSIDSKIEVLSLITRLREICVEPRIFLDNYNGESSKLDVAMNIINDSIDNGHKILLFSQFTSCFEYISERLNEDNIKYYIIKGDTKPEKRMELVDSFNSNDDVKVFLISLKAGGTGLNLIGADTVIHFDPWWNISVENQATDRAHRIGQKRCVSVVKLICNNTIEQKVLELQRLKKSLSDSVIADDMDNLNKLSKNDIKYLLG